MILTRRFRLAFGLAVIAIQTVALAETSDWLASAIAVAILSLGAWLAAGALVND